MKLEDYKKLVIETSKYYKFAKINLNLDNFLKENKNNKICFLRHDIDFCPENALNIAFLENKHNIVSTYTILVTSKYYNAFTKENRNLFKKIKSLGHEVGLHFDPTVYEIDTEKKLNLYVKHEKNLIEDLIEAKVEMFSYHQPTNFLLNCNAYKYGGCINSYSSFFQNEVEYTSDSNGYWRFRTWNEILLEKHQMIQILTHPIWWKKDNNLPPFETIIHNCFLRYCNEIDTYTSLFKKEKARSNISNLTPFLKDIVANNDPITLNNYSKYHKLLKILEQPLSEIDEKELISISKEFLSK